jgi:tRNA 5-methylaminomethyl-2-thiouridine biosynthesis bifunctional protein
VQTAEDLTRQGRLRAGQDWLLSGVRDLGHAAPMDHVQAGWMKPARLVAAWLAQPGVQVRGQTAAASLRHAGPNGVWQVLDAEGRELAQAELVVVAAACASAALLDVHLPPSSPLPLSPVRGQISWAMHATGPRDAPEALWPLGPVNGNGHFIPTVPLGAGAAWFCGSTYERGETDPRPSAIALAEGHAANLDKLRLLQPDVAQWLTPTFTRKAVRAWSQIRCASRDRRPLVGLIGRLDGLEGPVTDPRASATPGSLALLTALGSRGLSFAVLCAELLAAQLHAEPLPLPHKLARALDVRRVLAPSRGR